MAKKRAINIQFPLGGLDKRGAYRQQSPFTTTDALNVRPFATLEGRERGGSRPGLGISSFDQLGSGPVRMLEAMSILSTTASLETWNDKFDSYSLSAAWAAAAWDVHLPAILTSLESSIVYSGTSGVAVRSALAFDEAETYRIAMYVAQYEGAYHGKFKIFARMDDTTPNVEVDGITAELVMEDGTGAYTGSVTVAATSVDTVHAFTAGTDATAEAGWFILEIASDNIRCLWNGTVVLDTTAISAATGKRFGFGMECTQRAGACLADIFEIQYVPETVALPSNTFLVASAGGDIYNEGFDNSMTVVTPASGLDVRSDVSLAGVQIGQKLYIGDYDLDDTRVPKIYDPLLGTLTNITASAGTVPKGCPCIARFRNRLVLAGEASAPHVWYMARQDDPTDWDYAEDDAQAAVAGTSSEAGVPGEAIRALVSHSDDHLIMGCENSLWIMRGDPAAGGSLDNLSLTIGIVGPQAWTIGPSGELIFLSHDGIYILAPGGTSYPISVSRQMLPQELLSTNALTSDVMMEYDVRDRGVHIYIVPKTPNDAVHWWMDWERKTFWPITLPGGATAGDHEPTAICRHTSSITNSSGVILGGRDGYLRKFNSFLSEDEGTAFDSYVVLGPLPLGNDVFEGKLVEIMSVLDDKSNDVTWEITPGDTYEGAVSGTAIDSGTWTKGSNYSQRPGGRGMAFTLKLTGGGKQWAVERMTAIIQLAGKQRLL